MRIGVVAPARRIDETLAVRLREFAAERYPAIELLVHPQCHLDDGHFAGPDAMRAAALVEMANDPAIDAIWFARGGYGSNRLLDRVLPALTPAAADKVYLGYSDLGFLLAALYAHGVGRPVHGPVAADILRDGGEAAVARALDWLMSGDPSALEPGLDDRPVVAFNLTILATLVGTRWLPDLTGHVLLIEEVSEPLYRIDRMLFQLASAPELRGLAGIRLGRVGDVIPNDPPWTEPVEAMVARWCAAMDVPWLGRADIGHDAANRLVPFGACAA